MHEVYNVHLNKSTIINYAYTPILNVPVIHDSRKQKRERKREREREREIETEESKIADISKRIF